MRKSKGEKDLEALIPLQPEPRTTAAREKHRRIRRCTFVAVRVTGIKIRHCKAGLVAIESAILR
jgi:hypothetical protein